VTDLVRSIVRTATPMVAGLLVAAALRLGYELDDATAVQAAGFAVSLVWYVAARLVESKWPKFGWLLGSPNAPTYGNG